MSSFGSLPDYNFLNVLHILTYLILPVNWWGWFYCNPYFTDGKTEGERD